MEESGLSLRRGIQKYNETLCIICQKPNKNYVPTSKDNGCERIRWAAHERKDVVFERLNSVPEEKQFIYHMTNECYRNYTMKEKVERAAKKLKNEEDETLKKQISGEASSNVGARATRSKIKARGGPSVLDRDKTISCVICGSIWNAKISKKFRICEQDRGVNFLKITRFFKDEVFTRTADLKNLESLFAADIYYHKNCMRSYEKKYERVFNENLPKSTNELNDNFMLLRKNSISTVINKLIPRLKLGQAFTLTEVSNEVNKLLPPDILIKNVDIKNHLVAEFGEEIKYSVPGEANKPTLFFHSSVSLDEVVEMLRSKNVIKESAKIIKQSLYQINFDLEDKFCDENNLSIAWDGMQIPSPLLTFFSELFNFNENYFEDSNEQHSDTDEDDPLPPPKTSKGCSKTKTLKIKSLFQMMYYVMHGGKKKLHYM